MVAWEAERKVGPKLGIEFGSGFEVEFDFKTENRLDVDAVFRWKLFAEPGREAAAEAEEAEAGA